MNGKKNQEPKYQIKETRGVESEEKEWKNAEMIFFHVNETL
jgi:hypothetical protein